LLSVAILALRIETSQQTLEEISPDISVSEPREGEALGSGAV